MEGALLDVDRGIEAGVPPACGTSSLLVEDAVLEPAAQQVHDVALNLNSSLCIHNANCWLHQLQRGLEVP